MGVFNKIFLKFAGVFWDKDYELIGYMGSSDCQIFFAGRAKLAP